MIYTCLPCVLAEYLFGERENSFSEDVVSQTLIYCYAGGVHDETSQLEM